ncbi:Nuclear pore RNA shuttling protein Mtr2 family protein [Saccharomyces cerevisiae]|nr:Nuclear pore RNA shuttling protein Mtr2 family protein [Saccharomyces cerevisiae]
MNTNSNTMVMNDANQAQITATFTKKILAHLDDPDSNKLAQFVVQTQHALTGVDYHAIPGSGTLICNVNCKVRFDESGRDKMGQDATVPIQPNNTGNRNRPNDMNKPRPLWGPYFGISLQLIIDDRIFRNDFNGVISGFNYNMVYKPEDSLLKI